MPVNFCRGRAGKYTRHAHGKRGHATEPLNSALSTQNKHSSCPVDVNYIRMEAGVIEATGRKLREKSDLPAGIWATGRIYVEWEGDIEGPYPRWPGPEGELTSCSYLFCRRRRRARKTGFRRGGIKGTVPFSLTRKSGQSPERGNEKRSIWQSAGMDILSQPDVACPGKMG